jgi:hypothetical protein
MKIKAVLSANSLYQSLLFGLLFIVAIYIRIWTILHVGDFAWDEMFSLYYAQKPWGGLIKIMLWETNPPLHLFFLKNYFYLFPATEFWTRLPSLIIGIVGLLFLYCWTKKLFSKQTALFTTIILALHPFLVYASALNRIYSALVLLALLSYYFFQKIFFGTETKKARRDNTFFILAQFFLFFSHLTFVFIIFAQITTLVIFARKKIKKYFWLNLMPGLIWLVWFLPSWYIKIKAPRLESAWFFHIGKSDNPIATIASVFSNTPYIWLNIFFFCLVITGVGKIIYQQIRSRQVDLNFWIIFIPVFLTTFLILLGNLWQAKFFVIILPFIAITIAYSLKKLLLKNISSFAIIISTVIGFYCWTQTLPLNDWTKINDLLTKQSLSGTTQVLVDNHFINWIYFPYHYTAPQNYLIYRPNQTDWDELIVAQNYRYYQRPIKPTIDWLKKIGEHYEEIIVYQDYSAGVNLEAALDQLGWKQTYIFPLDTKMVGKDLILYAKPKTTKN